ncbi:NAD(P)H-hydrate dehydratase [bacterium RCC_150]
MSGPGDLSAVPVTPTLLRSWPLPALGSGKRERGTVLVIGGARRTPGAVLLAGMAALRAGAGRLTLAVAESAAVPLAVAMPEAGVVGLPESPSGSVRASAMEVLEPDLEQADSILLGPGLDNPKETAELLRNLLAREQEIEERTIVLDAFALGVLSGLQHELRPWAGRLILTPNPTELRLLLGREPRDFRADTVEVAQKYRAVVSCQGVIAEPRKDGEDNGGCWELTTGSGGLGTSGSGDVLSGTIAGLCARGTNNVHAACWGSHLHAAAGDRLASRKGSPGYLARELSDELPPLMMELGT